MSQVLAILLAMALSDHGPGSPPLPGDAPVQTLRPHEPARPDDVIVDGYRGRRSLPTLVDVPNNISTIKVRTKYEMSERIAACASRGKVTTLARLRAVVDGEFNSSSHALAQDRLKRIYISCSEGISLLSFTTTTERSAGTGLSGTALTANVENSSQLSGTLVPNPVDAAPLGHSVYDRGAFMIRAMQAFTPELTLTQAQTSDPKVQERFDLRELPRNRFRDPVDYQYFQVAVCMVRLQPALAVKLALTDRRARMDDLQATLINRSRICIGNSPRLTVDPTQFRIYIADAVYRWAAAAQNVASLIPDG